MFSPHARRRLGGPKLQPVHCSPQAQTGLHSQRPRLLPHQTPILGLRPHLESNESELIPLLRAEEAPLSEGTLQARGAQRAHRPRGHEVGGTCGPGQDAGTWQRLGLWERSRCEARASLRGRRGSGGLLCRGERQAVLGVLVVNKFMPTTVASTCDWLPGTQPKTPLATPKPSCHSSAQESNDHWCPEVNSLCPNF